MFDKLKQEMLKKYPSEKSLPWTDRIQARFVGSESEAAMEFSNGTTMYRQCAVIVSYKGKDYLRRFGRLYE